MNKSAQFSPCRKYRYSLGRIWQPSDDIAMCIGLNPSTANAEKDDPTITTLIRVLRGLGYGGFIMVNLYGLISSKPETLLTAPDPLGENEIIVSENSILCDTVIFCWGNFKQAQTRALKMIGDYPNAKCFGINSNGSPMHPLALMYQGVKAPILWDFPTTSNIYLDSLTQ